MHITLPRLFVFNSIWQISFLWRSWFRQCDTSIQPLSQTVGLSVTETRRNQLSSAGWYAVVTLPELMLHPISTMHASWQADDVPLHCTAASTAATTLQISSVTHSQWDTEKVFILVHSGFLVLWWIQPWRKRNVYFLPSKQISARRP